MTKNSWMLTTELESPYLLIHHLQRPGFFMATHSHPFWQVILITEGQLEITVENHEYILHAGNIHILPPHCEHALSSPEGYSQLGIDMDASCTESGIIGLLTRHFGQATILPAPNTLSLVAQMTEEQQKGTPLSNLRIRNLTDSLILDCIEAYESCSFPFETQLITYLDANLHQKILLQDVADYFFISVPHLERRCHQSYHCGAISLLQQRRLKKAQILLLSTPLLIREIGACVGFEDTAHFSNFFKNHCGISPREYRNQKTN